MSEQPRLLLCCFDVIPAPTGLSRRVTEYLKGLSDRFQVVVLSIKTPDHSHIERYHGARLLRVPVGSGDLQSRIQSFDRAVRRQLESEEYVIAHFFDPFGGYALADSRPQYGFRLVYDAQTFPSQELRYTHPSLENDRRFLSKVRRQELFCLMNADAVICGAEVTRDFVLKLGTPPASLHVFRAPVDLAPYTRDAMGKPDGSPMKLLHLGSQIGYQGLPTLLRAMQLALRQVDLRLLVVGPTHSEWQTPLEELVSELKLAGKVEFQAPVVHDNLCKVIATADVGVAALDASERNLQQGGPIAKLGEYLAAGRPVIATDLPITRELLPEGARVLFPPGDFKALAETLVQLATNPAQRVALGEAARANAARFDASAVRGKLLDLYGALSTRGKVSPSEAQGEVTQLRASGSDTSKIALARSIAAEANRAASETVDEEPPVVVGQSLDRPERAEEASRGAVTEPLPRSSEAPVVMGTPLPATTDEHTPIRPGPDSTGEPTPITAARGRRVPSKTGKAVSAPPQPVASIPIVPSDDQKTGPIELPPRLKRTSEGKGIRSPALPPPSASPPVRIKLTTEGKGVRSPVAPHGAAPHASPPRPAPSAVPPPASPPRPTALMPKVPLPPASPPRPAASPLPPATASPPRLAPASPPRSGGVPPAASPPHARPPSSPGRAGVPLPPDVATTAPISAVAVLAATVGDTPPPRVKRTTEGKGVRSPLSPHDDAVEISADEVESIEEADPVNRVAVDPWLAQLLFGYCPPEALPFERPPPPTAMPGRDAGPPK